MNIIDEIKSRISIIDLYPKKLNGNRGHCALHDNTNSPSFVVYGENWYCFSCGTGGDVITLYGHLNGLDNKESIIRLAKELGLKFDKKDENFISIRKNIHDFFRDFVSWCHDNLKNSKYYDEIKRKRGFTDDTMSYFRVGLYDPKIKKKIERKYDEGLLVSAGFLNKKANVYFSKRIVYPYLDFKGRPCYFAYRLIDDDPDFRPDAKYIKHLVTDFVFQSIFGLDSLIKFKNKPLIITEGITDAMSVFQCEYPVLSPVTVKFSQKLTDIVISHAKRFNKVIIIFDVEENQVGLKNAEKTAKLFLKHGINACIGIIPNPENLPKIDLDMFLRDKGVDGLDLVVSESIDVITYFCNKITGKEKDDNDLRMKILEIFDLLDPEDVIKRKKVFNIIKERTKSCEFKLTLSDLRELYNHFIKSQREKKKTFVKNDDDLGFLKKKRKENDDNDDVIFSFEFKGDLIEVRKDGIWKVTYPVKHKDLPFEEVILDGYFELIHKTRYLGRDYFSYKFRDDVFNTQSRTLMMIELRNFIYGGEKGKDIVKKTINELSKSLEYKKCKLNMGFEDGWVLPFLEDKEDYKILIYTDAQRRIYRNCRDMIREYSPNDKFRIRELLMKFLERTQMNKSKLAIIIGWSMASVFKLTLLKYFKLFPGLMLQGDRQSGKTYICSFFTVDFFGAWKSYLSGASMKTEARCEDFLATSTFPLHLDELEFVKYSIIEILKSTLTGIHDYVRKLNLIEEICKPEIAPFCITTNNPPRPFLDPALNSKMLVINFEADETIKDDPGWIKLYNTLKDEKLFSFLYEHTKDWRDSDVFRILESLDSEDDSFKDSSRLRKKWLIIRFGLKLFRDVFDIDYEVYLDKELFLEGESVMMSDLLDKFLVFCKMAIKFSEDSTNNPKFITCYLYHDVRNKRYLFGQNNLRDFNEFLGRENFYLKNLGELLNDALKDKSLIKYGLARLHGIKGRYIIIDESILTKQCEDTFVVKELVLSDMEEDVFEKPDNLDDFDIDDVLGKGDFK